MITCVSVLLIKLCFSSFTVLNGTAPQSVLLWHAGNVPFSELKERAVKAVWILSNFRTWYFTLVFNNIGRICKSYKSLIIYKPNGHDQRATDFQRSQENVHFPTRGSQGTEQHWKNPSITATTHTHLPQKNNNSKTTMNRKLKPHLKAPAKT